MDSGKRNFNEPKNNRWILEKGGDRESDDCWPWIGCIDKYGYGAYKYHSQGFLL